MKKLIGLVGAGRMGKGLARNLTAAGHKVTVFRRSPGIDSPELRALLSAGTAVCESLDEILSETEVLALCLPDSTVVEEMVGRVLKLEIPRTELVIDFSTARPESTRTLAHKLSLRNIAMLDAPMTGGPKQAWEGKLGLAVGGTPDDYRRYEDLLKPLAVNIFYAGSHGSGNLMKLLNNFLSILNTCATGAVCTLADASGVDRKALYQFISCSGGNSSGFQKTMGKIMNDDFPAGFTLNLARKDILYAKELFDEFGGFQTADSVLDMLDRAAGEGYGPEDIGTVYFSLKEQLLKGTDRHPDITLQERQ